MSKFTVIKNDDIENCLKGKTMNCEGGDTVTRQKYIQDCIDSSISKGEIEVGLISDGYHTFDELYFHRMVLFSVICSIFKENAWKSKLHADGTMYLDYFIVGITTPQGDYSYHYHTDHWDYFKYIKELEQAPEWDGHRPTDITRLLSLLYPKEG